MNFIGRNSENNTPLISELLLAIVCACARTHTHTHTHRYARRSICSWSRKWLLSVSLSL